MQSFLQTGLIPSMYLALQDNDVLGTAALEADDLGLRPELTPWLASVYVRPDVRRRGLGSRLIRHVMETAAQAGNETLYLFTPDQERLYRGLGWSELERLRYHREDVTIMSVSP